MEAKDIQDLILTIDKTTIETVEIEKADLKIKITKKTMYKESNLEKTNSKNLEDISIEMRKVNVDKESIRTEIYNEASNRPVIGIEGFHIVKSPIVGTFYAGPSPDAPNFVKVGDLVEKGQTVCIIEAMKIMNEIECEESGEVVEVLVTDEDIVEYGQPLMRIRR